MRCWLGVLVSFRSWKNHTLQDKLIGLQLAEACDKQLVLEWESKTSGTFKLKRLVEVIDEGAA